MLTAIRENAERAEFVGLNVRRYQLAAFAIAGVFAGFAGALFGMFNRGVFPDFAYWSKSAEVLIMAILGGIGSFWGPAIGAAALTLLNHQITSVTQYWPLVLGVVLIVLLFAFPGGIAGALGSAAGAPARSAAMLEVARLRRSFGGVAAIDDVSLAVARRARSSPSSAPTAPASRRCST